MLSRGLDDRSECGSERDTEAGRWTECDRDGRHRETTKQEVD